MLDQYTYQKAMHILILIPPKECYCVFKITRKRLVFLKVYYLNLYYTILIGSSWHKEYFLLYNTVSLNAVKNVLDRVMLWLVVLQGNYYEASQIMDAAYRVAPVPPLKEAVHTLWCLNM